ncbi:MAG: HlyD family efflux transporter periplasmic adaptor subunit [Planctomycetaceae bacterium]
MVHRTDNCPELPAPPGRIVMFALLALFAGSALAYTLRCSHHPRCLGYVAVRTTYVMSDREGVLEDFTVQEGEEVGLDTPLIQLSDTKLQELIAGKEQEIEVLKREVARTLAEAELEIDWRTRALNTEICDIQLRSASFLKDKFNYQLRRTMLADVLQGESMVMVDGADSLYESIVLQRQNPRGATVTSMMELEAAANSAEVSAVQVEICDEHVKVLTKLRDQLPAKVKRSVGVDVAEARLAQAEEELKLLEQSEDRLTICSPAVGRVGVFQVKRGDQLHPGVPIVELLDSSQRFLVVHVPSQQITNYTIDTRVKLIFPGNQPREGRVYSIAPQALPQSGAPMTVGHDAPVPVHVEQVGSVWPDVPIGSRVTVELQR